jgi:hypothetical protein
MRQSGSEANQVSPREGIVMKSHNRTRIVRYVAGVAALATLGVACSGSSDGAESEVTTPASAVLTTPVTEAPTTLAPVVTDPPASEEAVDPADIPDLPCSAYVAESGYPLKPCDSGVLVETLQRDLESLFPAIAIDGLFGGQTFEFVKEFQSSNALEATGIVSEELAGQIATADALGEGGDNSGATEEAGATEGEEIDAATEELCTGLIGNVDDPNFTAEQVEACSELGIDIVGEG